MATGDASDFAARLAAVLPRAWFPSVTPVLTGVLTGLGAAWAKIYAQISYTILQARVATATDVWLDQISFDFYGGGLPRIPTETDAAFRVRVLANFLAAKGTRAAVIATLTSLTGTAPSVFEPNNTSDTKGWGKACGYGVAGGYGNINLPFSFFLTAYRPSGSVTIAGVDGYGGYLGGYGRGAVEYAGAAILQGNVTDGAIQNAVMGVIPAGVTAWMNITAANPANALVDINGNLLTDALGNILVNA